MDTLCYNLNFISIVQSNIGIMISTKAINDIKVKLIPNDVAHGPENPMFAHKYSNVFLSGKNHYYLHNTRKVLLLPP